MAPLDKLELPQISCSRWDVVREHVKYGTLKYTNARQCSDQESIDEMTSIHSKLMKKDSTGITSDYILDMINDSEVLRRDSRKYIAVGEFITEVRQKINQVNNQTQPGSFKKLRGIIRKTIHFNVNNKPKSNVCFSEENIYIEIPRRRKKKFTVIEKKCTYYCCFGFLFPSY